jgi:hypothetical protein
VPDIRIARNRLPGALAAAFAALWIAGCGSSGTAGSSTTPHPPAQRFLSVDPAARAVRVSVVLGYGHEASMLDVDGARKGGLLFTVPVGWRATFECENRLQTARYACGLAPAPGTTVPQPGLVYVAHPAGGIASAQRASFTVTFARPGRYRIVGLTRARGTWEAAAGMWAVLRVGGGAPQARWLR